MEKISLSYAEPEVKLKSLVSLIKSDKKMQLGGTWCLAAGTRMPVHGRSAHSRHEVSIILDGTIETQSGGRTIVLQAGDLVSIPEGQEACTEVIEDTRLIYIFFDK